LFVNSWYCV